MVSPDVAQEGKLSSTESPEVRPEAVTVPPSKKRKRKSEDGTKSQPHKDDGVTDKAAVAGQTTNGQSTNGVSISHVQSDAA